jgi:hypothetical protein
VLTFCNPSPPRKGLNGLAAAYEWLECYHFANVGKIIELSKCFADKKSFSCHKTAEFHFAWLQMYIYLPFMVS